MLSNEQVISIATELLNFDEFQLAVLADTEGTDWLDNFHQSLDHEELRDIALMMHTGETFEELSADDYFVYDCDEAYDAFKQYAQNYYEDIIEPEIPEYLRYYFDEESWISDYINDVDRGNVLSSDGYEHEYQLLGQTFYIYAQ